MHKDRLAFTLLESLIVLTITMMVFGLGLIGINRNMVGRFQERLFWQSFHKEWQFAERIAIEEQVSVNINFYKEHVQFIYPRQKYYEINYPKGLHQVGGKNTIVIRANGHISPKTIYWQSVRSANITKQTFQLGWGVYRIKN